MDSGQRVNGRWVGATTALTLLLAALTWLLADDGGYEFTRDEFDVWVWYLVAVFGIGTGAGAVMLSRRPTRARGAGVLLGMVFTIAITYLALVVYVVSHGS